MKLKILFWAPRIICILAIAFLSLFSFDVFDPEYTFGQQMLAFFTHNIPALFMIIVLIIAWKWELTGGIIIIGIALMGLLYTTTFFTNNYGAIIVVFPFLLAGILFIIHHFLQKNKTKK